MFMRIPLATREGQFTYFDRNGDTTKGRIDGGITPKCGDKSQLRRKESQDDDQPLKVGHDAYWYEDFLVDK